MARSKHDEDNPINLLKRIKVLETRQRELEELFYNIMKAKELNVGHGMADNLWNTIARLEENYYKE